MSEGERLLEFLAVMRRLRAECSWKQGQTHRSLARYLLEETYETLEALDTGDDAHLREELGDLLLQIWFHAVIAEERGAFSLEDVATGIVEKMRRRNPHVFDVSHGDPELDAVSVNEVWESIKATEKKRSSVFEGIPPELPALLLADKVLDRLSREGRQVDTITPAGPPAPAVESSSSSVEPVETLGDRLLALVAEARAAGVDPEQALRDAVRRLA